MKNSIERFSSLYQHISYISGFRDRQDRLHAEKWLLIWFTINLIQLSWKVKSTVDYIMVRQEDKAKIRNVKVIASAECVQNTNC